MKQIKSAIKTQRIQLHILITALNNLVMNTDTGQYNTLNAWHSCRMARGWLGKTLGAFGDKTPYKPADKPENIPPTADTPDPSDANRWLIDLETPTDMVAYINALRIEIKKQIEETNHILDQYTINQGNTFRAVTSIETAWRHLHETSMNLGYQLEHLREQSEEGKSPRSLGAAKSTQEK